MNEKSIVIPTINLQQIVVSIEGTTPLLTNRFSEASIAKLEDTQQHKAKQAKEARKPEAEFQDACHKMGPGKFGFPAVGIKKGLVAAGFRFADEKSTVLRGVIAIPQPLIQIIGPKPTMRTDAIRLQGMKSSLAYRPQFDPWSMDIPVTYNATLIGQEQLLNLFQIAGFAIGIGAWRPECNGVFGQFRLKDQAMAIAA